MWAHLVFGRTQLAQCHGSSVGLRSTYSRLLLPCREDRGKPEPPEAKPLAQGNQADGQSYHLGLGVQGPPSCLHQGRRTDEFHPHTVGGSESCGSALGMRYWYFRM